MQQIRGDTKNYFFQRKSADGEVIMDTPDSLYFTVKEKYTDIEPVFQKTLADMEMDEEGIWHFTIEPEDTDSLAYKTYVYDIQVTQDGIKTTIARGNFVISEEVTFAENEA